MLIARLFWVLALTGLVGAAGDPGTVARLAKNCGQTWNEKACEKLPAALASLTAEALQKVLEDPSIQQVLAVVAVHKYQGPINPLREHARVAAARYVRDRVLLNKIALRPFPYEWPCQYDESSILDPNLTCLQPYLHVLRIVTSQLTDESTLMKMALKYIHSDVGVAAASRVTSSALVADLAKQVAQARVRDPFVHPSSELLNVTYPERWHQDLFEAAISRITDPLALTEIALLYNPGDAFGILAVAKVSDPQLLMRIIDEADRHVAEAAVKKLPDDDALVEVTLREAQTIGETFRGLLAVQEMKQQSSLLQIALTLTGSVAVAATGRLSDPSAVIRAAQEARDRRVRVEAVKRISDQRTLAEIALSKQPADPSTVAATQLTDQDWLAKVAVERMNDAPGRAATARLTVQPTLRLIASKSTDLPIRKLAFSRLSQETLVGLVDDRSDLALQIAAKVRLQRLDWNQALSEAKKQKSSLGVFLKAAAVFEKDEAMGSAAADGALLYIRAGDPTAIAELVQLLALYGNKQLAEDYVNCGQSDLEGAGRSWAAKHGYWTMPGNGSARARWGGAKR